jgi:predicted negative regulator of RcsB-dependent stress response
VIQPFGPRLQVNHPKDKKNPVDTQTRHALKNDKFAQAAASSASWVGEHRTGVLRWVIGAAVVLVLIVAALVYWNVRTAAADHALGGAMDVYNTPLAQPGEPSLPGVYSNAQARATEANREFVAVAHDFSGLPAAAKAHYFAGISFEDLGQNGPAETELKAAADSWNHDLSNLAKLALAGLYHQTGRDGEAVTLYQELAAKPSVTVSTDVAQLDLADLYAAQGKKDLARTLWAKIKDSDKEGAAGSIASQKLNAK